MRVSVAQGNIGTGLLRKARNGRRDFATPARLRVVLQLVGLAGNHLIYVFLAEDPLHRFRHLGTKPPRAKGMPRIRGEWGQPVPILVLAWDSHTSRPTAAEMLPQGQLHHTLPSLPWKGLRQLESGWTNAQGIPSGRTLGFAASTSSFQLIRLKRAEIVVASWYTYMIM